MKANNWKKTANLLPEAGLEVLVWNENYLFSRASIGYRNCEGWFNVHKQKLHPEPTHWMELPKGPSIKKKLRRHVTWNEYPLCDAEDE